MLIDLNPIRITRRPRRPGGPWLGAASWFGGLPRLGRVGWPRSRDGHVLPFVAQIAFAEVLACEPGTGFSDEGSLAFFLGDGGVVHVPSGELAPTELPPGPLGAILSDPNSDGVSSVALDRIHYPYWPVEFSTGSALPPPDRTGDDPDTDSPIVAIRSALATAAAGRAPLWSRSADLLAERLAALVQHARHAVEYEASPLARQIEALAPSPPNLQAMRQRRSVELKRADAFIVRAARSSARQGLWNRLSLVESKELCALIDEAITTCGTIFQPYLISADELSAATALEMMTGDATAFAALPLEVRDLVNSRFLSATRGEHLMFGSAAHGNDILLFQAAYDEMMHWEFGDGGSFQFWISRDDLAARNWRNVRVEFCTN